eukprot:TRINITY_DN7144_c0_g1_i1.p1 TRINITY_DN7144_c0_g1~~TRINITY_DN7144_c0_g1_i1.p1  ORF type:complete len:172 (+),score=28.25 TRINITY_DN7144_c0_g1_i1:155-670(+)
MSQSRSRSRGGGGNGDKLLRLRKQIEDFCDKNKLDDKVSRIMTNMHPTDAKQVMDAPFPSEVRSPSGFVISVIRKVEKENQRPQGYRWDGHSWDEPPKASRGGSRSRSRGGGGRGGGRGRSRSRSRRGGGGRSGGRRRARSSRSSRSPSRSRRGGGGGKRSRRRRSSSSRS